MKSSTKDSLITLAMGTFAVCTVISVIYLFNFFYNKPSIKLAEYTVYATIKGKKPDPKIGRAKIAENHQNDKPATFDADGVSRRFQVKGRLSLAYLYIEALVDYNRPLTVYDDVYFKINDLGGHLIPDGNALPVPPAEISRYLYDLRSISYYPTINAKGKKLGTKHDLLELLHDGANIKINAFISSDRPGSVMKEVSIYYECFKESKCSINEIK